MTFTESVTLTKIECGQCGGAYAINECYRKQREQESGFWNCPYCKTSWGYGDGENARLKRELEEKSRQITAAKCDALREKQFCEAERRLRLNAERKLMRVGK